MPLDPSIFTVGLRENLPIEVRFSRMNCPEAGVTAREIQIYSFTGT